MSVYEPAGHVRAHEIRAEVVLDLPEGRAVVAGTIRVLADGLPYAGADLARASGQTLDAIRHSLEQLGASLEDEIRRKLGMETREEEQARKYREHRAEALQRTFGGPL